MIWEDGTRSINGVLKLEKVTLTTKIGKYPAGTKFDWVFVEPDPNGLSACMRFLNVRSSKKWVNGKLELIKEKQEMGVYELQYVLKEVVSEPQ